METQKRSLPQIRKFKYLDGQQILPSSVNFLLSKTIPSKQGKCVYKVYEFKLAPGHYHAKLVSPFYSKSLTKFNFTKEQGKWQTPLRSKEAKRLVEIFGNAIAKSKN